jgi:predicted Zn-dependent peptidase
MSQIKTYTFPNGFRVIHEPPYNNMALSNIKVYCRLGSIYENDHSRGASHMIEHMCFKGTKKHPSANDVTKVFDRVGAYLNATTDKQYTFYTVECNLKDTSVCLQTVADMMLNSTFARKEFDKELNVVIEENVKDASDPLYSMLDNLDKMIFVGTPYEYTVDDIKFHTHKHELKYDDTFDMYKQYYVPHNMLLSIISPLSFEKVLTIVEKSDFVKPKIHQTFPSLNMFSSVSFPPKQTIQLQLQSIPSIQTTHIGIGFRVCSLTNEKHICLLLLVSSILSGSFMSRLYIALREENGLTYSSESFLNIYEPASSFIIRATTDTNKVLKNGTKKGVIPVLMDLLNDLIRNGVSQSELNYTKQFMEGNMRMLTEKSNVQVTHNAKQIFIYNREDVLPYHKTYNTYYKKIRLSEVNSVIRTYFTRENMFVSIYGGKLPSRAKIEKVLNLVA